MSRAGGGEVVEEGTLEFEVEYGGGRSQKQHTVYMAGEPDQQLCSVRRGQAPWKLGDRVVESPCSQYQMYMRHSKKRLLELPLQGYGSCCG